MLCIYVLIILVLLYFCYFSGQWDQASVEEPPPEKPSKKPVTKPTEKKGKTAKEEPQPLDPVAEKLRQQRYQINIFISAYLGDSFISVLILI